MGLALGALAHPRPIQYEAEAVGTAQSLFCGQAWSNYRLGDIVRGFDKKPFDSKDTNDTHSATWDLDHGSPEMQHSIAAQYLARTDTANDFQTLAQIVREQSIPAGSEAWCALHVRAGDAIELDPRSSSEMLNQSPCTKTTDATNATNATNCKNGDWSTSWVQPLSYWSAAITEGMPKGRCSHVHIIAGSQYDLSPFPKSMEYLLALEHHVRDRLGYTPVMRLGQSPDEDFAIFARCSHFIASGDKSGFGALVKSVREALNMSTWAQSSQAVVRTEQV